MAIPCTDPALHVVQVVTASLRAAFAPDSVCPPDGGGTTDIRFFATDEAGIPPGLMPGCDAGPLVWVRFSRRYRASRASFPAAVVANHPCAGDPTVPAVALEVGVARCSSMEGQYIDWEAIASEELVALDDSFRIDSAQQTARRCLQSKVRAVAVDSVAPIGPEGGIRGMTGMLYVELERVVA